MQKKVVMRLIQIDFIICSLINQFVSESDYKLKLKQTDNNSKAFSAIINGTEKTYDKFSNVIENYNFF